jgi:hypothetical protein
MTAVPLPRPVEPKSPQLLLREHQGCAVGVAQAAATSRTEALCKVRCEARQLQV